MRVTKKVLRARFDAVKEALRANPGKYDQRNFCGSVCCIGGWLDRLEHGARAHNAKNSTQVQLSALKLIGQAETCRLPWIFTWQTSWPVDLYRSWYATESLRDHVEIACQAIDRYVAERGA